MLGKFSAEKRGTVRRQSFGGRSSGLLWNITRELVVSFVVSGSEYSTHISTSEETTSKRRIRYYRDPKLAGRLEQADLLVLDVKGERRVLNLDCGYRVDGMCTPQSGRGNLREAEILDFALPEYDQSVQKFPLWLLRLTHFTSSAMARTVICQAYQHQAERRLQRHRTSIGTSGSAL